MRLCLDLGFTLSELTDRMSYEEIQLWSAFYQLEADSRAENQKRRG